MSPRRVLFTARDPGGAGYSAPLIERLLTDPFFKVTVVASDAASGIFDKREIDYIPLNCAPPYVPSPPTQEIEALRYELTKIIQTVTPDIALFNLSAYRGGVDDVALEVIRQAFPDCTTAMLFDSPGLVPWREGCGPDTVLATTRAIEDWTGKNLIAESFFVGDSKAQDLRCRPVMEMRRTKRADLQLAETDKLCTFIAQGLNIPGHDDNFAMLLDAYREKAKANPSRLIIRAHPVCDKAAFMYLRWAEEAGITAQVDKDSDIHELLCASDAIFAVSSTALQDYVQLRQASNGLNAVCAHLLIGNDVAHWMEKERGGWIPEVVKSGQISAVRDKAELIRKLNQLFSLERGETPVEKLKITDDPVDNFMRYIHSI